MSGELEKQYQIDILAQQAGGYFSLPDKQSLDYTDLLFSICEQFGSATIVLLRRNAALSRK